MLCIVAHSASLFTSLFVWRHVRHYPSYVKAAHRVGYDLAIYWFKPLMSTAMLHRSTGFKPLFL